MKKWIVIAVVAAIGVTLPLLGAMGDPKKSPSPDPVQPQPKFQIIDAHFQTAYLQDQAGIVKINTVTGESWRYLALDGEHCYWVPIETLKEVPKNLDGTVKAKWTKLNSKM